MLFRSADKVLKQKIFVVAPASGEQREQLNFTLHGVDEPEKIVRDDIYFERPQQ